ncbi:MAG: PAS domain-containing protein [Deltaproteobacteria bacterium]|nr:PAS domain-containing protein [Deltaproteobacteria bacterium]
MLINLLARLKATLFFKILIALNLLAFLGLACMPSTPSAVWFSLVVHVLLAVALGWFMVNVVWPVRASLDELVLVVDRYKSESAAEVKHGEKINMGSYLSILKRSTELLVNQYEELISRSRQLENFSRVLEKQNLKVSESRQRYRRTLDALENGLYLIDDNYVILAINRAEAAYVNSTPKELVGKHCYEVFRHRQSPCSDCMPRDCLNDGQGRNRLRVEKRRAGREYVNIYCYPIFHGNERQSHEVVIYIQDTSPLVMMEDQVIRTEKMASIGQMAAGIAHDLNNYLAAIYGVVQLLQMRFEASPEEREKDLKLLGRLRGQVEALNLLSGNLMIFSHPERKEMFPLSLNQVIEDALSFSRYELEREQVEVVRDFDSALTSARMEKGQIQQVMLNLMLNGAQAIRERKSHSDADFKGKIVVTTGWEDENHIFFSVADNGAGISHDCQKRLFDPFFSTKEVNAECGATGLGLFTAQTIVAQHQGRISFTSAVAGGSTFKVVLPLRQEEGVCV